MNVEIIKGISKKTNKEYECIKLSIGMWNKLLFVTPFELDYIKSIIGQNSAESSVDEEIKKEIEVMFED